MFHRGSLIVSQSGNTKITCPLGNKTERIQTAGWEWDQRSDRSRLRVTHSLIYQTGVNRWRFFFLNQSQSWIFATPPFIHLFCFIFHVYRHRIKAEYAQGCFLFFFSFIIALVLSHRFYNWSSMSSDCLAQELVSRYRGEYRCVWEPMLRLRRITSECNVSHTWFHGKDLARHVWNGTIPKDWRMSESRICSEGCTIGYWQGTKIPCLCVSPLPYSRQNVLVFN